MATDDADDDRPRGNPHLRRRDLLGGLRPRDFLPQPARRGWPWDETVNVLRDEERRPPGLDADELARWLADADAAYGAVQQLAAETRRYLDWKTTSRQTITSVARRVGVSRARVRSYEDGDAFPRWDLPFRIRAVMVEDRLAADRRRAGEGARPPQR